MRTRKSLFLGKNTWELTYFGSELDYMKFDPLFEVTGRRKLDNLINIRTQKNLIFRQKHMGIDTFWEFLLSSPFVFCFSFL